MQWIRMDTFLGRTAFPGAALDRSAFRDSFLTQANFHGHIMFSNWPRTDVERLLPRELELCTNTSSTPEAHPVVFIFGAQKEGAMTFGGLTVPLGVNYEEVAISIPFVRHKAGKHIHVYVARMYSSYAVATWNGNFHYGFSKEMAKLWWQGPIYVVTREDDALLMHTTVEPSGDWVPGCSCELPNFAALHAVFALPILGRKTNGMYVCSYFGWDFGNARVRPADACVSIDSPLIVGLTPRRCHNVPSGTFEVDGMLWKLSWPIAGRL